MGTDVQLHFTPTGRVSSAPTTGPRRRQRDGGYRTSETTEQIRIIQWARGHMMEWPCLAWLHHIPNGGGRSPKEAAILKRAGVTRGVPDLCLPWPSGGYHGLYLEIKAGNNKMTAEQAEFIRYANAAGYRAVVCYGADAAINAITDYLTCAEN